MSCSNTLWYKAPAKAWTQSLPIGNGTLGAMIYGGTKEEKICLNHDELWTGKPKNTIKDGAPESFKKAQKLALEGRLNEAQKEVEENFQSVFSQAYMPLGTMEISFELCGSVKNYKRSLDLRTAVSTVEFSCKNVCYKREYLASYPDKAIAAKFTCSEKKLNFTIGLTSKLRAASKVENENTICLDGECPGEHNYSEPIDQKYFEEPEMKGMSFRGALRVDSDGKVERADDRIKVSNATYAYVYFTAETSFNGWNKHPHLEGKEYIEPCMKRLEALCDYDKIKANHLADYTELYNRVSLDLGGNDTDLPTDKRLNVFKRNKADIKLIALVYNYGRFLAISSSREGTQPGTLQGIWNDRVIPPWNSNYTVNINTEMNYWPVLMCRMPEVNLPLIEMVKELSESGKAAAKGQYGAKGWTSHHNVDIWRLSTPVDGNAQWAFWHGSSGWLCEHLFEHHEYTSDVEFLKNTAYPIMKGAAEFYLDILTEYNGNLVLAPGTSPENSFWYEGKKCSVAKYSTMSMSIARELFENCIKACGILGIDADFAKSLKDAVARFPEFKFGSEGQLLEFDDDYEETEIHHRHCSHLYALHPARIITSDGTPELADACRKTLARRGDNGTGWSLGWKINFWARLFDGDHALKLIEMQLRPVKSVGINYTKGGGTYENLFDAHPPFQIDGNFGFVSGITEMLVQSYDRKIYLLPALPSKWESGSIKGVLAKGNVIVDLEWNNGNVTSCKLEGKGEFTVIANGKETNIKLDGKKAKVMV
ncbi:MAG: glycoside hydrolase family 95 protein [Clostridia bacterium]|nr:glycoside hydrolase family 95 protein [Clostridia bacterium]